MHIYIYTYIHVYMYTCIHMSLFVYIDHRYHEALVVEVQQQGHEAGALLPDEVPRRHRDLGKFHEPGS